MRRFRVGLLVVLAVVGVGGVLADNYVRGRAEARAATALQARLGLEEKPGVELGGFTVAPGGKRVVVVATLDNLLKGAATQAMQNLNLAFGFNELASIPSEETAA